MIFTIAQDKDIELNLTGLNNNSYNAIRKIVFELFKNNFKDCNEEFIRAIDENLKFKLDELKLSNLEDIMEYIELLPDCEILDLFDILIQLSSMKLRFSNNPHSIGRKCLKAILRKYDGVKFIE